MTNEITEVAPRKKPTTAGRLRTKFEGLIERDTKAIEDHQFRISVLETQVEAWQTAIAEINAEPAD